MGLDCRRRTDERAVLGADGALLVLVAAPEAPPRGAEAAGLFHTAFRVPDRAALGDALARIEGRGRLDGASDHGVSEALYLTDPEGNGIEVYRDRPRAAWPVAADGTVEMDTRPLALDPVREAAGGAARCPSGTTVGHVHLEVTSLPASRAFYVDGLGLRVRQSMGASALFLAADDYHHHVGLNTWRARSAPAAGRGVAWVELVVADPGAVRSRLSAPTTAAPDGFDVADPDGIELRVRRV